MRRKVEQAEETIPDVTKATGVIIPALALFWSLLNEKQRRLFAGLTSLLWGYGGDQRAANVFGLSRKTVRKGRIELSTGEVEPDRVRRPGGGRTPLKKTPHVMDELLELIRPETAGDPMGGLLWTRLTGKVGRDLNRTWDQSQSNHRGEVASIPWILATFEPKRQQQ